MGSELTISVRKSGRRGKLGHGAAKQSDGSAQQPRMLNKEEVKWKEKRDCEEGRINELSLGYSFPLGVPAAGSHLGAPALLPVPGGHQVPALCWSKRDWAPFKFPVGCGELGAKISPALASLPQTLLTEQHFLAFPVPGLSSEIKTCLVYLKGKGTWGNRKTISREIYCKENMQCWGIN